jgi:hypothetical protein
VSAHRRFGRGQSMETALGRRAYRTEFAGIGRFNSALRFARDSMMYVVLELLDGLCLFGQHRAYQITDREHSQHVPVVDDR